MQLLTSGFLNIILTAIVVSLVLASIATLFVWRIRPARSNAALTFLAIFAFSILGFVTGKIMGNSREAAVGTVVPAVLTLLGGVSVYVIGVKGTRVQGPVSAMMLCFALSLFVGSHFGSQLRYDYEVYINDPELKTRHAALEEKLRLAVELARLSNFVELRKLEKSFEAKYGLDLSTFEIDSAKPKPAPPGTDKK